MASANLRYIALRRRLASLVSSEGSTSEMLNRAAGELYRALPHYTAIAFFRRDRQALILVAGHGADAAVMEPMRSGVALETLADATPVLVADASIDRRVHAVRKGIVAELAVPILHDDEVVGVIDIQSERTAALGFGDRELLSWLGDQVGRRIRQLTSERDEVQDSQIRPDEPA